MEIRKREGEAAAAMVFRFSKRIQNAGLVKEARRRRYKNRNENKNKRRASAIYRTGKAEEVKRLRKLGKHK